MLKTVRGLKLIDYLLHNFEFKNKPIFLIRHPIEVAESRIKNFKYFKKPINENLRKFNNYFENTRFENEIISWCEMHSNILNRESDFYKKLIVDFYSDLKRDTYFVIMKIFSHFDFTSKKIKSLINRSIIEKKSSTYSLKKGDQVNDYFKLNFTENQLNSVQKILDFYNIRIFSARSRLPNKENLNF